MYIWIYVWILSFAQCCKNGSLFVDWSYYIIKILLTNFLWKVLCTHTLTHTHTHTYTYTNVCLCNVYIIIIIIIKSCWFHGFPLLSLAIHPYHPSLLAGPPDCIQCLNNANVCMFLPVSQRWYVLVQESMREYHLWDHLTSPALPSLFCLSYFDGLRFEVRHYL